MISSLTGDGGGTLTWNPPRSGIQSLLREKTEFGFLYSKWGIPASEVLSAARIALVSNMM
nr:MAG TPA: Selenoprotein S (SelS) [Bacteriophage sp.]